jgi:Domain of unknown function (DUF4388)
MELTGDLGDFALTDILQILSLSRKTGMVSLEGPGWEGKIIVEDGRITHSSVLPGETLTDSLALSGLLEPNALRALAAQGNLTDSGADRLVGSGILSRSGLTAAVRRHTQQVIAKLVRLEKGRFSIALGEATLPQSVDNVMLAEGLDVGEALLQAAQEQDESYEEWERAAEAQTDDSGLFSQNDGRETHPLAGHSGVQDLLANQPDQRDDGSIHFSDRSSLLCSLLAEMKQHSFEAEISLLLMRYASELAARGILFAIKEATLCGLGQFGLNHGKDGKSADEMVRELCLPLGTDSVLARVLRTGEPFIGAMPESYWFSELLSRVGGFGHELTLFVLPLICNESPAFVIYGDNYPGNAELCGLGELVALASQASLALERIALQRRVVQLEARHQGR